MSKSAGRIITGTRGDVLDAMHGLLVDHDAWTYIDEYVASNSDPIRVYRCLGTHNAAGRDFVVAFRDAASSNFIQAQIMDDFDEQTQIATNYPPTSGSSLLVDEDGAPGTSQEITNSALWGNFSGRQVNLTNGTSFNYYVSVTSDRIVISVNLDFIYVGLFDTISPLENEFPVCIINYGGTTSSLFLRHPGREGQTGAHFRGVGLASVGLPFFNNWHRYPGSIDFFVGERGLATRVPFAPNAGALGVYRGFLRDFWVIDGTSPTEAWSMGDTFTDEDTEEVYDLVGLGGSGGNTRLFLVPTDAD